jgi:hypothetical protein
VPRFVEEDGDEFVRRTPKEGIEYHHFWDGVVGAAGMSAYPSGGTSGGKEDDRVPAQLNVAFEGFPLLSGQCGLHWV